MKYYYNLKELKLPLILEVERDGSMYDVVYFEKQEEEKHILGYRSFQIQDDSEAVLVYGSGKTKKNAFSALLNALNFNSYIQPDQDIW